MEEIKSTLKWWVYPSLLWPTLIGNYLLSKLSIDTQLERFNNDPIGAIIAGLLLFATFFVAPAVPFLFFKTYRLKDRKELTIKNLIFRTTRKFFLDQINKVDIENGIYGLMPTTEKRMTITLNNGQRYKFSSKLYTNYALIEEQIINASS